MSFLVYSNNGEFVTKSTLYKALTDADTTGKLIVNTTAAATLSAPVAISGGRTFECRNGGYITGSNALTGLGEAYADWFGAGSSGIAKALLAANVVKLKPHTTYAMDSDITIDASRNSLIGSSTILDFSAATISANFAVKITSLGTGTANYLQSGNTIEGVHIKGDSAAVPYGLFFDRNAEPGPQHLLISKVSIYGFQYGEFFKDNSYIIQHLNCDIFSNTVGISNSATTSNGGEKLSWIGCAIFNNETNIWQAFAGSDMSFADTSIDYPGVEQIKITAGVVNFSNCHIEGYNVPLLTQSAATYATFNGCTLWQAPPGGGATMAVPFITVNGTVSIIGGKLIAQSTTLTLIKTNATSNLTLLGSFVSHGAPLLGRYDLAGYYLIKDSDNNTFKSSTALTLPSTTVTTGQITSNAVVTLVTVNVWVDIPVGQKHGLIVYRDSTSAGTALFLVDPAGTATSLSNAITGFESQVAAGITQVRASSGAFPRTIAYLHLSSGF
jgi:hypothetical protein